MNSLNEQSKGVEHENYVIRRITKDCFIATPKNVECFYYPLENGTDRRDPIKSIEEIKNIISHAKTEVQPQPRNILDNENIGDNGVRNYTPLPNMSKS